MENIYEIVSKKISSEIKKYRREIEKLGASKVYDKAWDINIVEEVANVLTTMIKPVLENYSEVVVNILKIYENDSFLKRFVNWAANQDNVDVSTFETTIVLICDFCNWYKETNEG